MEDPGSSDPLRKISDGLRGFDDFSKRMLEFSLPHPPVIPTNPNLASEFHKRLAELINDFDKTLDAEHEVGVRLVSFGQALTFHLESLGYWSPSLISFQGMTDQGEPVKLIQHVSQISILLMKVARKDPAQPKNPIGFSTDDPPKKSGEK